ncbi:hypothetical protein GVAV_003345 [Gurleya vavrai]
MFILTDEPRLSLLNIPVYITPNNDNRHFTRRESELLLAVPEKIDSLQDLAIITEYKGRYEVSIDSEYICYSQKTREVKVCDKSKDDTHYWDIEERGKNVHVFVAFHGFDKAEVSKESKRCLSFHNGFQIENCGANNEDQMFRIYPYENLSSPSKNENKDIILPVKKELIENKNQFLDHLGETIGKLAVKAYNSMSFWNKGNKDNANIKTDDHSAINTESNGKNNNSINKEKPANGLNKNLSSQFENNSNIEKTSAENNKNDPETNSNYDANDKNTQKPKELQQKNQKASSNQNQADDKLSQETQSNQGINNNQKNPEDKNEHSLNNSSEQNNTNNKNKNQYNENSNANSPNSITKIPSDIKMNSNDVSPTENQDKYEPDEKNKSNQQARLPAANIKLNNESDDKKKIVHVDPIAAKSDVKHEKAKLFVEDLKGEIPRDIQRDKSNHENDTKKPDKHEVDKLSKEENQESQSDKKNLDKMFLNEDINSSDKKIEKEKPKSQDLHDFLNSDKNLKTSKSKKPKDQTKIKINDSDSDSDSSSDLNSCFKIKKCDENDTKLVADNILFLDHNPILQNNDMHSLLKENSVKERHIKSELDDVIGLPFKSILNSASVIQNLLEPKKFESKVKPKQNDNNKKKKSNKTQKNNKIEKKKYK